MVRMFVNFDEFLSPKHGFLDFSIAKCDSIILQSLGWMFFAISCFITGFIAYSKAIVSSKRDNGSTKRFFDRVTLEESRSRVFQKR